MRSHGAGAAALLFCLNAYAVDGIWVERIEADAARETFTLTARKPNYFLVSALSSPNQAPYEFTGSADRLENEEIKFQLSFQTKLGDDLAGRNGDLWFGYTQVSYWQLFSVMLRDVLDREHRLNSELQWSFPIVRRLRGLVQWYNGYGENLIDYNHNNHRLGVGVLLTDWL